MRHFNIIAFTTLLTLGLMNPDPSLATDPIGEKESECERSRPRRNVPYPEPQLSSLEEQIRLQIQNLIPTGTINAYAGMSEPQGWLFCHGQALSRLKFGNLYQVIGTKYGRGDGTSTFNFHSS